MFCFLNEVEMESNFNLKFFNIVSNIILFQDLFSIIDFIEMIYIISSNCHLTHFPA